MAAWTRRPSTCAATPLGMGRAYSAIGMNLVMSVLHIEAILKRKSAAGGLLWPLLYVATFAFDAIHVVLVWTQLVREGKKPWRRA